MKIHWARVVIAAFVLELVLFATLIPIQLAFGMRAFLIAVPIGVFVEAFLITRWFLRRVQFRTLLHGLLIGVIATLIYLGLALGTSGSLQPIIDVYGPFMAVFGNLLRIAGALLGAASVRRR